MRDCETGGFRNAGIQEKRLNALVSDGQIRDWHPGRWIDWGHTAISITFDSVEDATLAKTLCLDQT